ncbi:hypothetical protein ACJX0J_006631, partial [Zea mays]
CANKNEWHFSDIVQIRRNVIEWKKLFNKYLDYNYFRMLGLKEGMQRRYNNNNLYNKKIPHFYKQIK